MNEAPGPRIGDLLANRFHVLEVIGRGGMGVVVRAFDRVTSTEVAVKHVRPDRAEDPDYAERLLREASLARDVSHHNVCRVHDAYHHGDEVLLSMEYVQGETLRKRLDRGPMDSEEALAIARQICAGVAAAHEKGVVHRDLKPENILLDETGRAVVLDFGVARKEGTPRDTVTGVALGTPRYMAPEQQQGKVVTPQADVFALGLVIEELYGNRRPPSWLRPIIRRATERDPTRRQKDAAELGQMLMRPWLRTSVLVALAGSGVAAVAVLLLLFNPNLLLDFFRTLSLGAPRSAGWGGKDPKKTVLTRQWGGAQLGTVSPDGKLLAYLEESNGAMEGLLRPLRESHGQPRRFSHKGHSVTWISFSPDSQHIAFSIGKHIVDRAAVVYIVDVELRGEPVRISQGTTPSWYPDGQSLVMSHYNQDTGRWHLARVAAQQESSVTSIEADPPARFELSPVASPDGKRIAYVAGPAPGGLRVIPARGGAAQTLDDCPVFYERVQWTPDSKHLIYGTEQRGLLSISVSGKARAVTLLQPSDIPHNPSLSADGKLLVYTRAPEIFELWMAERDGRNATTLSVNMPTDTLGWPLFSPNGKTIAMVIGVSGQSAKQVALIPQNGGVGQLVGRARERDLGIAPESFVGGGEALIVGSNKAGGLEVITLDPARPIPEIKFSASEMHAAVSPDGKRLATTRMEGREGTIVGGVWVRPIDAPPEEAVCWVEDGFGRPTWSPSSDRLAVGTSRGLAAISSGPGQAKTQRLKLFDPNGNPLRSKYMRFASDGKLLLADYPHIYEVDIGRAVANPIISPQRIANMFGFTVSPDGSRLVYVIQPMNSDLWLVEASDRLIYLAQHDSR